MAKIAIVGAGSLATMVEHMLIASPHGFEIVGYLEDAKPHAVRNFEKYPLLGPVKKLPELGILMAVVAIGDNAIRAKILRKVWHWGIHTPAIIHPSATICPLVKIGEGSLIMPHAVVAPGCTIGRGCIINTCSSIDHDGTMEDFSHLASGAHTAGCVTIGKRALVGVGASVNSNLIIGQDATVVSGCTVFQDLSDGKVLKVKI